jgi:selenocysteine lyase/cysteine desulfurase
MEEVQKLFSDGCNLDLFVAEIIMSIRPIRESMARIVNSPAAGKYIGTVDSVTEGMSLVANGLTFEPGDAILITDHEHTGGRTMWELQRDRHGATVVTVPLLDPDDTEATWKEDLIARFAAALATGDVKVVSFPWVTTSTGHVLPAKELCALAKASGAISVVDAAQAFAILPIDVTDLDCDFLVAIGHKYLCGPVGSGFVCVNPRRLTEISSFWPTVVDEQYYNPTDLTKHYPYRKSGVAAYTNLLPLQDALLFYESLGASAVHARLSLIGNWLRTGLATFPDRFTLITPRAEGLSCVMTCFKMAAGGLSSEEVTNRLKDEFAIHAKWSTEGGADAVRLSPHYYTKVAEFEKIAKALCAIAGVDSHDWFAAAPLDLLRS